MFKKYFCLTILALTFASVSLSRAAEETKYTFVFPPNSLLGLSPTEAMGLLRPMTDYLGRELGTPVEVKAMGDSQVFFQALEKGEIDLAIADIPLYLKAREDYGVIPLVKPKKIYQGILVALASSGIRKIEDARGNILASSSRYSMASYYFPRRLLAQKGLGEMKSFFAAIEFTGKDIRSLQSLITREVDIASVAKPTYSVMITKLPALKSFLKVIETSPDYPYGPIFVRKELGEEKIKEIKTLLLNFKMTPEQKKAIKLYFPMKVTLEFVTAEDSDYLPFRDTLLK